MASVSATEFRPSTGPAIPATSIRYTVGSIAQIRGTVTYTVTDPNDLANASIVVTASGASGNNAAATAWNPTLSVSVPSGAIAGTYTATISHSVL